jgi:4-hydroxybutyrate CoA-transferase
LADIVVTEFGIAHLRGNTHRERALELIAVAHPDFRAELKRKAEEKFWTKEIAMLAYRMNENYLN